MRNHNTLMLLATLIACFILNTARADPISDDKEAIEKFISGNDIKTVSFWSFNYIYPQSDLAPQHISLVSMPSIWPRLINGFGMPEIVYGKKEITHVVKRGDTLSGLSERYGVSVKALKARNKINGSIIRIGQKLFIHRNAQGKRVINFEKRYKNNIAYLSRIFNRSQKYIHFILGELEKRNMPTELALLPMVESAYYPVAYSRAHAAGLWQFIPSTGKNYGLEQTWWRDERRDVIASTKAALDYLQVLHAEFNDWQLALAAYNWGENGLRRSIKRNKGRGKGVTYFDLKMPKETRNYVPKLQAIKNIVREANAGNLNLPHVADYAYFTSVPIPHLIDIKLAAEFAEIDVEEFEMLNPSHNRPVFTTNGEGLMLIPSDRMERFNDNLNEHTDSFLSWGTYKFKNGDTLSQTAKNFNINLDKLRAINSLDPYFPIQVGQSVLVPLPSSSDSSNLNETWQLPEFSQPNSIYGKKIVYRVKRGDTLSGIAKRYGVSIKGLRKWNKINGSIIRVNQKIKIYKNLAIPSVSKILER